MYRLSPAALADLSDIWDYTAERWGKEQAERYVLAIRGTLDALAAGKRRARVAGDVRQRYFKCALGSHMLYPLKSEAGEPVVIRILHQSMDVGTHIPID